MAFFLSPKVAVQEIDLSTTIPAVSTSISCIVLRDTYKGPELTQELITSENQLIDKFGKPRKRVYDHSGKDSTISSCYKDMASAMGYLRYGNKLYCTRTMPASATFAGTKLDNAGTGTSSTSADALTLNSETLTGDIEDPDEFAEEIEASMGTDHMGAIAYSRGYWGNNVRMALIDKTTQTQMLSGANSSYDTYLATIDIDSKLENDSDFLVIVQSMEQGSTTGETVEVHNVSLDEDAVDDQGITKFAEYAINQNSNYIRISIKDDQKNLATVPTDGVTDAGSTFAGGSDNGSDEVSDATIIEGYELYQNPEEIDINMFIDSDKSETVKRKLVVICESRLDAMAIVDTKYGHNVKNKGSETTDIVEWRKGIASPQFNQNSSYVATYGNGFNVYNKYLKEYFWVPTSGYMAGIYARTDNMRDPWGAPAGLNRTVITGVRKLAWNPTLGQRDILYKNGINPICSFSGQGKVCWGQKTLLDKSSAFNKINVRRLFMVLEKAISTASKYFLWEQNDRFTGSQMKGMIEPFLRDVKSRRGIYDFYVQIDSENNTPERIDRNELWASIFIKPTKSAENIVLQFVATKTGANFEELIGQV